VGEGSSGRTRERVRRRTPVPPVPGETSTAPGRLPRRDDPTPRAAGPSLRWRRRHPATDRTPPHVVARASKTERELQLVGEAFIPGAESPRDATPREGDRVIEAVPDEDGAAGRAGCLSTPAITAAPSPSGHRGSPSGPQTNRQAASVQGLSRAVPTKSVKRSHVSEASSTPFSPTPSSPVGGSVHATPARPRNATTGTGRSDVIETDPPGRCGPVAGPRRERRLGAFGRGGVRPPGTSTRERGRTRIDRGSAARRRAQQTG